MTQQKEINENNAFLVEHLKEFQELKENPPKISQAMIDAQVNEALHQHNLENFW